MISGLKDLNYEDLLDILDLWSLEEKRNRADLLEMFKMFIGVSSVRFDIIFELSTNMNTRRHALKIAKHRSRLDLRKHFSERVVNRWNSPEQWCVQKSTINGFKQSLKEKKKEKGLFTD